MMAKITLTAWAARQFDPAPCENTLRIWARNGRIIPAPMKIGRTYYVEPTAQHWKDAVAAISQKQFAPAPRFVAPLDFDTIHARDCAPWVLQPDCIRVPLHEPHPVGSAVGLYALFKGEKLVYIGRSSNIGNRVRQHYMGEKLYDSYACLEVPDYAYKAIEAAHIRALNPPLNAKYEPSTWPGHGEMVAVIRASWGAQ